MDSLTKPASNTSLNLLLINGPNLNLLGLREPGTYGTATLGDVETLCVQEARGFGAKMECFQSNVEGFIVDRIHQARREGIDGVVINPGAYTHTSIAIRDAFLGTEIPFVEIHISNVHAREPFRHHSYLSDKAAAVIAGMGVRGYKCAVEHAALSFHKRPPPQPL